MKKKFLEYLCTSVRWLGNLWRKVPKNLGWKEKIACRIKRMFNFLMRKFNFLKELCRKFAQNPPWLHHDIRMFNTLWKSEIGKFIFRLVTKWYMPLECYINPIKNVCLINIRNGINFPNTRTLLYDICYNLLQDAEIENFWPHQNVRNYDECPINVK